MNKLQEQLAAEREKYNAFEKYALEQAIEADNELQECHRALSRKNEQLAAEREKVAQPNQQIQLSNLELQRASEHEREQHAVTEWNLLEANRTLEKQLAAERERVAPNFKDVTGHVPAITWQGWTVETNTGSNVMKRIMDGEQKIIGWTMQPYCESFQKLAAAHNATLAVERDDFLRQLAAYKQLYEPMGEQLGTAVEALEKLKEMNDFLSYPSPRKVVALIDAALAKIGDK